MASIITTLHMALNAAPDAVLIAAPITAQECAYCGSPIASGERWVREKIFDPFSGNNPRYRRYHADLFIDQELCCWEKRVMELEMARFADRHT
jgi:hypothetical protein